MASGGGNPCKSPGLASDAPEWRTYSWLSLITQDGHPACLPRDPERATVVPYGTIEVLAQTIQITDHEAHAMPVEPSTAMSTAVISHAIQLAIAPVFLLTGIAGLLAVMATRLGRIIDRARNFEKTWSGLSANARAAARVEMGNLERRRRVCSYCTSAALLVCLVIVTLFVEEFFATNLQVLAGALFVGAMVAVICGLVCFLREVYLATHTISIDHTLFE